MREVVAAALMAVGVFFSGTACSSTSSNPPQGRLEPAPTNALTAPTSSSRTIAPSVPTVPVEVSGSGDTVTTVNLEKGGYTVEYTNSTGFMIVKPVNRDGSTALSIINANDPTGVTTYASKGPLTLQVENAGEWSMRFVPLA